MERSDYNAEPVYWCSRCGSLKVRVGEEDWCDDCGSHDIEVGSIEEYINLKKDYADAKTEEKS